MKIELHCAVCGKTFIGKMDVRAWRLLQELRPNMKHVCGNCSAEDMFKKLGEEKTQ